MRDPTPQIIGLCPEICTQSILNRNFKYWILIYEGLFFLFPHLLKMTLYKAEGLPRQSLQTLPPALSSPSLGNSAQPRSGGGGEAGDEIAPWEGRRCGLDGNCNKKFILMFFLMWGYN